MSVLQGERPLAVRFVLVWIDVFYDNNIFLNPEVVYSEFLATDVSNTYVDVLATF